MKEFTQPQIDSTRQYFEGNEECYIESSVIEDIDIEYWVIPQSMNLALEDFALRMTITDPATEKVSGIFGVSDSIPQELRPYWVLHELIEFTQIGIETEGRCANAERAVVSLLQDDVRESYIKRRITFFTDLITFFESEIANGEQIYTDTDIKEAQASFEYLKSL